jgi:16S rRNA (guanine527-N7)-methyltransferase
MQLLVEFREWLASEAIQAGGLGPNEDLRIDRRHISDSLLFARLLPVETPEVVDLGSGVGLPGIPLAIMRPETRFRLIDRSQRRVGLMKRAVRILGLPNVEIALQDIEQLASNIDFIVSRATIPPQHALGLFEGLLTTGGTAVLGGSWTTKPSHDKWETVEVGTEVLDQAVWLLIIHRR